MLLYPYVMRQLKNRATLRFRNNILTVLFLIIPIVKIFGTAQIPDILIYKGDTLSIFSNPLELLYENDTIRPDFFGEKEGCMSTACWRGYQAEWIIADNQLFLTGIYSCCFYEDSLKADLTKLFPEKYINGKVKAEWVTGNIIAPQGEMLYYVHMGYESLYEKELELEFDKGILIRTKSYDNSKSKQSIYSQDSKKLLDFIYSNINWEIMPKNDSIIKVYIQFSANENGIIDSLKVMRGHSDIYDKEAIRVVKSIPEWDIYYRHGIHERRGWNIPIVFSEEKRKKYNE